MADESFQDNMERLRGERIAKLGTIAKREPLAAWRTIKVQGAGDAGGRLHLFEIRATAVAMVGERNLATGECLEKVRAGVHAALREVGAAELEDQRNDFPGTGSQYEHLDLAATLVWLAAVGGDRLAALQLAEVLAWCPPELRGADHAALIEDGLMLLPNISTPLFTAIGLGLQAAVQEDLEKRAVSTGRREATFAKMREAREEHEKGRFAVEEEADGWQGARAQVMLGKPDDLVGDLKQYRPLARKLPIKPWPAAAELSDILIREFPWAQAAIGEIVGQLKLRERLSGGQATGIRPLCLLGEPGTGKSRLAVRLSQAVRLHGGPGSQHWSAAGSSDNRLLAGTARGWGSACPSLVALACHRTGTANALVVVDELCKISGERNGNAHETLLTLLEPTTSERWTDECIGNVDVSRVTWLFTANDKSKVPAVLRHRIQFVEVPRPRPVDFPVLLSGVLKDIADEAGGFVDDLPELPWESVRELRAAFIRGSLSARGLNRFVRRLVIAGAESELSPLRVLN